MTCPHWLRIVWPHSPTGPRIAYTAAQVAARRAAQMVLIVGCTVGAAAIGYQAAQHAPASWLGLPPVSAPRDPGSQSPGAPRDPGSSCIFCTYSPGHEWLPVQRVPEPPTWPLLAIGIVGLVAVRNWRRHGRSDLFIRPADPERGYQQAALSLHDAVDRTP